jgi:hypothetical protein
LSAHDVHGTLRINLIVEIEVQQCFLCHSFNACIGFIALALHAGYDPKKIPIEIEIINEIIAA